MIRLLILLSWLVAAPLSWAACEPPQARYAGPLFDAMAQIDVGMESAVLRAIADSGVGRMALFGRDKRRQSGGAAVANLKRDRRDVFVAGAPKRFDQRIDLSDDYVRTILSGTRNHEYAFVGEILYAHADKDFRWRIYAQIVERWRAILAQLPPEIAEEVAFRNAERLYGRAGARAD